MATGGNAQVSLSWTASTGATSYNIYRGTTSGGEGSTPYRTGVTTTSFTDTGVINGTTYYYQITAVNMAGESARSNQASATPQAPAPAAPANLSANTTGVNLKLAWIQSTNAGVTTNKIYRATTNGGPYTLVAPISAATSYLDNKINRNSIYYYVVTAVTNSGQESIYSNQASGTTK